MPLAIVGVLATAKNTIPSRIPIATTTTMSTTPPTPTPSKSNGQNNSLPNIPTSTTSSWATYIKKSTYDLPLVANSSSSMNSIKTMATPSTTAPIYGPKTSYQSTKTHNNITQKRRCNQTLIASSFLYKTNLYYNPKTDSIRRGISVFSIIPVNRSAHGPNE